MDYSGSNTMKYATVLLAGVAACLAGLLLYQSQTLEALPGCGGGSGCQAVLTSRWSSWFGVPVSLGAMLVYASMLCAAFIRETEARRPQPALEWLMMFGAVSAIVAAIWFVLVQFVIVRSLCVYCMMTHGSATAAAVLCLLAVEPRRWLKGAATAGGVAVALVMVLIVGQVLGDEPQAVAPKVQFVEVPADSLLTSDDGSQDTMPGPLPPGPDAGATSGHASGATSASSTSGTSEGRPEIQPRYVSFYGGRFEVNTTDVPIIGDPNAPNVLAILFDYTCSHCQTTRTMLEQTAEKHGSQLAIVCLPTPLASDCNQLIVRTHPNNRYACDLAKLSLAVWRVAPEKWSEFDRMLYADSESRTPARAKYAAIQLLGGEKPLQAGLDDPWVKQQIERNVHLYSLLGRALKDSLIPILVSKQGAMSGGPRHPLDIEDLLRGKKVPGR